jgi:hypothetical protein
MASNPATTISPGEHAPPTVAACPKCNVVLVAAQLKRNQPGLMCPNCGVQGATVGEIAYKVRPPPHVPWSRTAVVVAWSFIALLVGAVFVVNRFQTPEPTASAPATGSAQPPSVQPQSTWAPVQSVVLTRVSRDHYRAEDGTLIVTTRCAERAQKVTATLHFDYQADASEHKVTFPSGRSCAVDFVMGGGVEPAASASDSTVAGKDNGVKPGNSPPGYPPEVAHPNPANDTLMGYSDSARNSLLTTFMQSGGEPCTVTRNFFRGSDSAGNAYWSVACSNGHSWSIQIHPDANGSTTIADCASLSLVGVKCFTRF